ncbi:zinc finger BED domain-containing protein RICESLEEPER 2-like [Humulus lupulus]|uniref:zinc finger BED domain-containing protein RICESLEEPER 2-like n=1 Tax=Humulus lupulus TaxID=3486 RepID=UPI002B410D68|nr:zinc finger BED domain-containing protein RICESLEEPER 2-like [Humulus lupulus]
MVENASSNDVSIRYLKRMFKEKEKGLILEGKFLHMRCCGHIVNLIINERLKEKHESIATIRNDVRYVRSSSSRLITFKEYVQVEGIECKGLLCLDVQTRWNLTFLMLNCALKFGRAFERMEGDGNYSKYFNEADKDGKPKERPPSEKHWQDASVFVRFLETFYDVSLKFSGSTYITANMYFIEICNMKQEFNDLTLDDEEDELLHGMAKNMKYKLDYLHHCFGDIHDDVTCTMMVKGVEQTIRAMFDQYHESIDTHVDQSMTQSQAIVSGSSSYVMSTRPTTNSTSGKSKRSRNLHDEYVVRKMEEGGKTKNEVDKYLEEAIEVPSQNFDVLGWLASI